MTRCIIKHEWSSDRDREVDLAEALKPCDPWSFDRSGGVAETARDDAEIANKAIGRLLAALVEKKALTVAEASEICGNGDKLEVLD